MRTILNNFYCDASIHFCFIVFTRSILIFYQYKNHKYDQILHTEPLRDTFNAWHAHKSTLIFLNVLNVNTKKKKKNALQLFSTTDQRAH